jgi:hypothetical protein
LTARRLGRTRRAAAQQTVERGARVRHEERAIGMSEVVLHVDDDHGGGVGRDGDLVFTRDARGRRSVA